MKYEGVTGKTTLSTKFYYLKERRSGVFYVVSLTTKRQLFFSCATMLKLSNGGWRIFTCEKQSLRDAPRTRHEREKRKVCHSQQTSLLVLTTFTKGS